MFSDIPCDPPPNPSLPKLLRINESVSGFTARKVLNIFNGADNVFEELEASDEEGRVLLKPPSEVARQIRAREAEHLLPVKPMADLAESMMDFQAGIQQVKQKIKPVLTRFQNCSRIVPP